MSFEDVGLSARLCRSLALSGYASPTDIQRLAIPALLKGKDVLIHSKTGSGKTLAFVLPVMQLFEDSRDAKRRIIKALILVPTRELAVQIHGVIKLLGHQLTDPVRSAVLVGGLNIDVQIRALNHGADIAIATPGRLLDIMRRQSIRLASLQMLVIDEADRMFDMGFAGQLNDVLKALPQGRQQALCSATMTDKVKDLVSLSMRQPLTVEATDAGRAVASIHQRAIEVNRQNRGPLLRHLIRTEGWEQALVFVDSVRGADILAAKLRQGDIMADALHGGMTQSQRMQVLKEFKQRIIKVLVATDLVARGIDIDELPYVVNYDLPRSPNDYIHRIGRTARAGRQGVAVSFVGHEDRAHFALIERRHQLRLERQTVVGFELTGEALPSTKGKAPVKGHRMSKKDRARASAGKSL